MSNDSDWQRQQDAVVIWRCAYCGQTIVAREGDPSHGYPRMGSCPQHLGGKGDHSWSRR
jgi:hypothetical protein